MTWALKIKAFFTAGVMLLIGITILGISWVVGVVECIHLIRHDHPFQTMPLIFAFGGMTGGGLIIQTGSLVKASKKLKEMGRGMPGGRRWYDEAATDESPAPPKEGP